MELKEERMKPIKNVNDRCGMKNSATKVRCGVAEWQKREYNEMI